MLRDGTVRIEAGWQYEIHADESQKRMTGTIINILAILIGSSLGLILGSRLSEKLKNTVVSGIGLFTLALGISMFLKTQNSLVVLGALLVGAILGEWMRIEERLTQLGGWLEARFNRSSANPDGGSLEGRPSSQDRFIRGFLTASLIYVIGPMAILGSIQDGLKGDFQLLAVKSVLDGFTAVAFASSLGIGVAFSAIPTLLYQGLISLLASQVQAVTTNAMMTEMTATGGVILLAIAFSSLLEIKKIRAGNFLPALFVAPLIVWAMAALGISLTLP
jgi:uncharacterized membrane protein YqgA involved in biofilm formation